MNEIVNKFLLVGDKLMSEMHLKQPGLILKKKLMIEIQNLKLVIM